jgi:LysM repeat protein
MDVMAGTSRQTAGRGLALGGAGGVCGVAAVGLAARVSELVGRPAVRADEVVELGVLAAGVLVLTWLAGSALLAAACVAARSAGRTWRRGEAWVHRFAPAVVRRALVVVVAAGLGASGVGAAAAAEPPTTSPTAVATATAPGAALDLGWIVTAPAAPSAPAGAAARAPIGAGSTAPTPVPGGSPAGAPTAGAATSSTPATAASGGSVPAAPGAGAHSTSATPVPSASSPAAGASADPASADPAATAPGSSSSPAAAPAAAPETSGPATVAVAPGDTLWAIAARHLPAGATDAQIAAAWPTWYATNAAVVGPDPDLILPGQVLTVPAEATR